MGGTVDKMMLMVGGVPLIRRTTETALATGAPVTVVLSPAYPLRMTALAGLPCRIARAPDAALGMAASVRRGVMAVRAQHPGLATGLMVLPADMPLFTTAALSAMMARFAQAPDRILRGGSATGEAGHPVIFPHDLWSALDTITGDEGGRFVLDAHPDRVKLFALPGRMAHLDLDTPADWEAWGRSPGA